MYKNIIALLILSISFFACKEMDQAVIQAVEINPAAEGFNVDASDEKAIGIADEVMEAMGGRAAYDSLEYLSWNFFGSRKHIWNKKTGDVRIESLKDSFLVEMNVNTLEGKIMKDGEQMSDADSLAKYLQKGKEMWINDAYWLVMPFKLKDSGVTLSYNGESSDSLGNYDVLQLTFENVGKTPDNKYEVYVNKKDRLINKWKFYPSHKDTTARFETPWDNYQEFEGVLLASGRGNYQLTEIVTGQKLADLMK